MISSGQALWIRFGSGSASLGPRSASLSESVAIFDPAPLKEIAAELGHTISTKVTRRFANVGQPITAVDGAVIETVKRVAELAWTPLAGGKRLSAYRLHAHFEVLSGKAVQIDATSANPKWMPMSVRCLSEQSNRIAVT